jgi:hypothetical protein
MNGAGQPSLDAILRRLVELGCDRLYVKPLARNDNTKNQPYFGPNFEAIHILPHEDVVADRGENNRTRFKAGISFEWLDSELRSSPAPEAKLIWYPQYPEVRFSGFLRGCPTAPSELMQPRRAGREMPNRILLLGISNAQRKTYGFIAAEGGRTYGQIARTIAGTPPQQGVFHDCSSLLPLGRDLRCELIAALHRIYKRGWIGSKRLDGLGNIVSCHSPNCGGLTLEAELGIRPNSRAEPDYLGWEVKQHTVPDFENLEARLARRGTPITLMTPEPKGGVYTEVGVSEFVRRYGYEDRLGREHRLNFGGKYVCNARYELTGMMLTLSGFDVARNRIDPNGALVLEDRTGHAAAVWPFAELIRHWSRKHAQAVYVPSMCEREPELRYRFASIVRFGEGTDFVRFVRAVQEGFVYYDPGIKLVGIAGEAKAKRRSQFRIASGDLPMLYSRMSIQPI